MTEIAPLAPNQAAFEFLTSRRSRPPRHLGPGAPDDEVLKQILSAAARVPDHGKMEPWRFLVLKHAACARLQGALVERGTALGKDPDKLAKGAEAYEGRDLVVVVVASPKPSDTIPEWEQLASAACVCLGVVNASLAAGWGAVWLSGWAATEAVFLKDNLGIEAPETVMGFIHIGQETRPPQDRPRPDVQTLVTWIDA